MIFGKPAPSNRAAPFWARRPPDSVNAPKQHSLRILDPALLIGCAILLGASIVYPTLRLFTGAIAQWRWEAVLEGAGLEAVGNTVLLCAASVLTSGIVGTALAFLVTRYSFPGRRPLAALAYLPFALPPLVGTLSFYYLIGHDGFVPRIVEHVFGIEDFSIRGPFAILLIHTYSFYVFFYAMVSAALEGMDLSQIEAARSLGATPWRAFRRVTVPMLTPALAGAALLTFMSSGASFSAPLFFGNDFPILSVEIYKERTQFHQGEALTLTVVLACVSLLGILVFRSRRHSAGVASKGAPRVLKSQSGRLLAGVSAWTFIAVILTPHFVIAWLSFIDHRAWYTEIIPTTFSLENYRSIFSDPAAFGPIRNSLWMSFTAALATLAVGLPAAYLIGRRRTGARWVNLMVMIPWALPGTVVAMNLITAFNDRWLPLYGTVFILPLAYFVRNVPLLTRIVTASVVQFDATLIEAGQTLGASRGFCFRHIVVPLLAPALTAATALVFATCLGEFVASILLFTPSNLPIAIQINMEWRGSGVGSAFAYSVFLMVLVTATFVAVRRFASRII